MVLSSYSAGTASIHIRTPTRTTSLKFRQIVRNSPPTSLLSLFNEDDFEDIDLTDHPAKEDGLIDNMPNPNSTAKKLSTILGAKHISSLALGNASIIRNNTPNKNRRSFYKWYKTKERQSVSIISTGFNDGKDELLYHGVQVTEIKSTVDPLILKPHSTHPLLQRPPFARLSY